MTTQISNSLTRQAHNLKQKITTIKLLVFSIGKLTVALPVDKVKQVKKYTPIHGSGMSHVNLTHIDRQEVTIIDLHQKLFNISHDELNSEDGYFVLTRSQPNQLNSSVKECLGIRVKEAPTLIDVSLEDVRILPNSYRYADTLKIASHVAVISQENSTDLTIFILDLECLI